jgi:hypothetical protein
MPKAGTEAPSSRLHMVLIESPRLRRTPFNEGGYYSGYFSRKIKAFILYNSNTFSR